VHRIDRDTSGVLLFATSREMREAVMKEWDAAEKSYLAIVEGHPKPAAGTIDQPLRLDPVIYQMHVGPHPDAKRAVTHFTTERSVGQRTLLRVELETGRQHQIRAHMAGTPGYRRSKIWHSWEAHGSPCLAAEHHQTRDE